MNANPIPALASSIVHATENLTADDMMAQWEEEDAFKEKCLSQFTVKAAEDARFMRWTDGVVNSTMNGGKNLSPYRAHRRRQKNKAARKAKRRNRNR